MGRCSRYCRRRLLTKILAQTNPNGIVAACGNAGGIKINTNVMPFIIRGVKLWGIDSSATSAKRKEFIWNEAVKLIDFKKVEELTNELSLDDLLNTFPNMLKGWNKWQIYSKSK